jgi:hypothetical protein
VTVPKPSRRAIAALGAVLLLGVAGVAVAQTQSDDHAAERQAFLDDVAKRLGVTTEQLEQAFKDARLAQVDKALADGKITEDEAQRMKDGIESGQGPMFGPGPGFERHRGGFGPGGEMHHGPPAFFDAAADYLGVTEAELRQAFIDGKSLADLAEEKGKSAQGLEDAIVASVSKSLDEAVAAGRITEEQKTEMLDRLSEHVSDLVQGTGRGWHHEKPDDGAKLDSNGAGA